jgi:Sulfotransferase domain
MTLQVVGAGLGRTGTHSLKIALEQLLDAPCYHMLETFGRPDDIPVWHRAVNGDMPDWNEFLSEYQAAVDWPAGGFWREIWAANPDAVVLLSSRDTDGWWTSANNTIFQIVNREFPPDDAVAGAQMAMAIDMFTKTFTPDWQDETAAKRAFEEHNAAVRAAVPADRLIDYRPGDGWEPICQKLAIAVPDEPFPHVNTTDEFRAMVGMDPLS